MHKYNYKIELRELIHGCATIYVHVIEKKCFAIFSGVVAVGSKWGLMVSGVMCAVKVTVWAVAASMWAVTTSMSAVISSMLEVTASMYDV